MNKIILLISVFIYINNASYSQDRVLLPMQNVTFIDDFPTHRTCGTVEATEILRSENPSSFDARVLQKEEELQEWIVNHYDPHSKKSIIVIPVVVQIWESTGTVPDSRVAEQIDRLNADFGRTNADEGNTPSVFSAVNCDIQFCLADRNPQGNQTTGIIRRTAGGSAPLSGGSEMWDPEKYLNIYVYNISGTTLGIAYPSSGSPNQAVHITTSVFGNTGGKYGMGRTATHEVGHHFNLKHIWGNSYCGDDLVADTPTQQTSNKECPSHPSSSCSNNGDMFMNYMDYVNDACMNAFTAGQKARMIASINAHRTGLLSSSATNCSAFVGVAEQEILGELRVFIYPNPSVGTIHIELTEKNATTISVLNILGEEIYSVAGNTLLFTIDMKNQPKGVYFVRITSNGKLTTKKVLLTN